MNYYTPIDDLVFVAFLGSVALVAVAAVAWWALGDGWRVSATWYWQRLQQRLRNLVTGRARARAHLHQASVAIDQEAFAIVALLRRELRQVRRETKAGQLSAMHLETLEKALLRTVDEQAKAWEALR